MAADIFGETLSQLNAAFSPITSFIEGYKESMEEARRERAARQLGYNNKFIENFNFSPKEFYVLLAQNLDKRRIPGMAAGLVALRESIIGSPKRLYLMVARERFVYYICAAPFGSGFFFSWRFVDERRPAKWYHIVGVLLLLNLISGILTALLTGPFKGILQIFGMDAQGAEMFNGSVSLIVGLLVFAGTWSAMRLASLPGYEWLSNFIEKVPLVGRVFERFYRPDTYYRQDTAKMYEKAFDSAVSETIDEVTNPQGLRHTGSIHGSPVVNNLHRR